MLGRELETLLKEERGQFFEFISAYEQKKRGTQTKRPQDLAREIARILNGMVNADGGVLLVGVEPDKSLTGLPFSEAEIKELGEVPRRLLNPPLPTLHERIDLGNLLLLRFEVSPGLEIRRVASGRTFYRIASENPAVAPEQIRLLKDAKLSYSYERQPVHQAGWEDLDDAALESFAERVGAQTDPRTLLSRTYHLVGGAAHRPEVSMAALLLFAREPTRWHPRCGIDFVKYEGTERGYGRSLKVVRRVRVDRPLWTLVDEAVGRIREHIRERMVTIFGQSAGSWSVCYLMGVAAGGGGSSHKANRTLRRLLPGRPAGSRGRARTGACRGGRPRRGGLQRRSSRGAPGPRCAGGARLRPRVGRHRRRLVHAAGRSARESSTPASTTTCRSSSARWPTRAPPSTPACRRGPRRS